MKKNARRHAFYLLLLCLFLLTGGSVGKAAQKNGVITASNVNVRKQAGRTADQLKINGKAVQLQKQTSVQIMKQTKKGNEVWYQVSFVYQKKTRTGYVIADYVKIKSKNQQTSSANQGNSGSGSPIQESPLTEDEFEKSLEEQGFPESYKQPLRVLHSQYPFWHFEAYQTELSWPTVIKNQASVGKNLITNQKNVAWKSIEAGAYDWSKDRFIPFDGSNWVTASKEAISYYMDPRNFLNETDIFQFECLDYQPSYQKKAGVENILKNTPLAQASYTYTDEINTIKETTYADTLIEAAKQSLVSPYHLASRMKQEIVTGSTTLSQAVSGTVAGYEGYYNFYNIGATHSTKKGQNIKNGLNYAKNGTQNAKTNALYGIPWDSPYKAIIGGAKFIGSSYIQKGQNTIYLQKFNVTPTSTHTHQYMANVEAAKTEAAKIATGYQGMENQPILFRIPVYQNMPTTVCAAPKDAKNPNNWLANLDVEGYSLTPTFQVGDAVGTQYRLIVPETEEMVQITAKPVNQKAKVTGDGTISLQMGKNDISITVTAENGKKRKYKIEIIREQGLLPQ